MFNRKLIDYLGEKGVLEKEVYKGKLINYHDALKTLYNARNLTENQTNFATAIIINKIIPYLKTELIIKDNKKFKKTNYNKVFKYIHYGLIVCEINKVTLFNIHRDMVDSSYYLII